MFCQKVSYNFILEKNFCELNFLYQRYRFSKANICLQDSSVHYNDIIYGINSLYHYNDIIYGTNSLNFPEVLYDTTEINNTLNSINK